MTAGRPIVAADAPGPAFLLAEGRSGVLYPRGSHAALADAVQRLLEDPALARRLGDAARSRAAQFTVDTMVSTVEAVWERVLAGERRPPLAPLVERQGSG